MEENSERIVLCGANAYEQKYYFNEKFNGIPESIKEELHIICVLFTEEVGGVFTIVFEKDGVLLVKRIAGCPGDQIDRTKISYMASVPIPIFEQAVITVPENAYFLLGDNAENSWDSRYWDDPFIPSDAVVAKLIGYS